MQAFSRQNPSPEGTERDYLLRHRSHSHDPGSNWWTVTCKATNIFPITVDTHIILKSIQFLTKQAQFYLPSFDTFPNMALSAR